MTITRAEVHHDSPADDETGRAKNDSDDGDSEDGNENSDLDEDCRVDAADFAQVLRNWT